MVLVSLECCKNGLVRRGLVAQTPQGYFYLRSTHWLENNDAISRGEFNLCQSSTPSPQIFPLFDAVSFLDFGEKRGKGWENP
ncbi:MAG TPA: hypothetical protein DCZ55_37660 [Cyanobacteria bacterium UBA11371]|nr:hypothetical protein [Cyanobacteria bacterium UBA11371]HBE31854.1 hypothetical protein [Cyanobacteria bacterium UBA11368]